MFAVSPLVIAKRRTSRRWGWCRRSSTTTCRRPGCSCSAAIVCGVASVALSRHRRSAARSHGAGRRRSWSCCSALLTLVTGPLWARKAWGTWWQWDVRLTSSLVGWMIACGVSAPARYGGPGSEKLAAGAGAVRHGQRAVHLHLGELLAHDSSGDDASCRRCRSSMGFPLWFCVVDVPAAVRAAAASCACGSKSSGPALDALYLSLDE